MMQTLKKIVRGISFALEGLVFAFKNDQHFRINSFLSLTGTFLSLALLEGCLSLVLAFINYSILVAELFNTAIERAVDTATLEFHPLAKAAKDVSSAAVLTTGIFALLADLIYLLPALLSAIL
ncbi:diacylglycerol kinase [Phorcysia thermohydrogeniphila]|uniref:Undecaprenol kinase/diacylglycerol kinase (ATP) n=1 Tax=Phorcysia thermohydrogeniphila TaxID=936138 RepID=A0A4R1GH95_9BACT|nr:diacylglycerol kinase family protein [Phorcysia thermohydrogeniphila]TCK06401.1 undecaprenol kinase/diacylglycerol kinase (ATP) [Phorcysia thermohydrogeniphila]